MPTPTIPHHSRNIGSLSGHHQHSLGMEKDNDQSMPTTPARIRTNTTVTGAQPTITIPDPNTGNGTIGIPPHGSFITNSIKWT